MNKKKDGQRGAALILVLIALALGSLLITPSINYMYTSTVSKDISEENLQDQYAADSAVEYAIWQLQNNADNITDLLSLNNPSSNTTLEINGEEISINTAISESLESGGTSFDIPLTQSGLHVAAFLEILTPSWSDVHQKFYCTNIIYICNYGTSTTHIKTVTQVLDSDLNYVENSYIGPSADISKTNLDDTWELLFDFNLPEPAVQSGGMMCIIFETWGLKSTMGDYSFDGEGSVTYAAFQTDEEVVYSGSSGISCVGLYDITVTVGDYTYLVNVGINEEGEIVIRSWQVL
ncbi:hypothetical protein ACFLTT_00375 [Chloroflexota bacterium]